MANDIKSLLKVDEGNVATVYKDSRGYLTIGVGFLVDSRIAGAGLLPEEIDFILDNRIKQKTVECTAHFPWFVGLDEVRQAVFISLNFQLGIHGLLGFSHMLDAASKGDWIMAGAELKDSALYKQAPARTERHIQRLITGSW